jgi:hypothetical protein
MCLPPYSASAGVRVQTNHQAHTQGTCANVRTRVSQIVHTTERTHTHNTHTHTHTHSLSESITGRERKRKRETLRSVGTGSVGLVPRSVGDGMKSSRNRSMSPLAPPPPPLAPPPPPPAFPFRPGLLSFGAANTLRRQPATLSLSLSLSLSLTAHAHACTHVHRNYPWI